MRCGGCYLPSETVLDRIAGRNVREDYIKTLLHELSHLAQWVRGSLKLKCGKMIYCQEPVENYEYWYQPHEIEARNEEERLYAEYIGVPQVQVAQTFTNRLCSV